MVAVTNENTRKEDIYILGGIELDQYERRFTTDQVITLSADKQQWEMSHKLLQARHGHRSWVSYGFNPDESITNYDEAVIWTVGGIPPAGSSLALEYFATQGQTSGQIDDDGTYDSRHHFDIMVFANGKLIIC